MTDPSLEYRITKLEVAVAKLCAKYELRFQEIDKALVLARELSEKDKVYARDRMEVRLVGMNEFQKRMDRLEGTFATKETMNQKLDAHSKIIYMAIGALAAIQVIIIALTKLI